MTSPQTKPLLLALNNAPLVLFALVLGVFGLLSPKFLTPANGLNILVQSSSTAIVAIGMTFVLLTAGVDLSVGAIMYVAAALAGKMILAGAPLWLALLVLGLAGLLYGACNALLVARLAVLPFVATLATWYLGKGFALWLTETREIHLPDSFLRLGTEGLPIPLPAALAAGGHVVLPWPVVLFAGVLLLAHLVLTQTPYGRRVHAVGQDAETARKAGLNVRWILASVYLISGACAALGAMVSLARLGTVPTTFGGRYEFNAIAAAVLGGTSLFGGRGKVFPGTALGAILIQSVENGLVVIGANEYLHQIITCAIIFLAVLTDSARGTLLAKLSRRHIRVEEDK